MASIHLCGASGFAVFPTGKSGVVCVISNALVDNSIW